MSLYQGRPAGAVNRLETSIQQDLAANDNSRIALQRVILAEALLAKGEKGKALAAAALASTGSTDASLLYPAALIYIKAGKSDRALPLARKLNEQFEPDPQAYGKLIEGEIQLKEGKFRDAVNSFQQAQKIADTWLGRYSLGRAYLAAEQYPEADSEFDVCLQRRGEATAVFLDDDPSLRYLPPVFYYQGRAREGLNSSGADSYRAFLSIKHDAVGDPLVADAKRRLK